jgi:hypothetical protein
MLWCLTIIDRFISAEMPPELTEESSEEDRRYFKAVHAGPYDA